MAKVRGGAFAFSQLDPDVDIVHIDACPLSQKTNLDSQIRTLNALSEVERESLILSTARAIIFMGSGKKPLDKKKIVEVVSKSYNGSKAPMNAVFSEACKRVNNIYGYVVVPAPVDSMDLVRKYQERYYLINPIKDVNGKHSLAINNNSESGAKGLLMVILALIYCKGNVRGGTKGKLTSRWLTGEALYRMMNSIDGRFPEKPPLHVKGSTSSRKKVYIEGLPDDVESLIDLFIAQDYLLKEKDANQENGDGVQYSYSMGPRSMLEIGRKQILYFTAEVLDEEPDPTMLQEIEGIEDEDYEEDEEMQ